MSTDRIHWYRGGFTFNVYTSACRILDISVQYFINPDCVCISCSSPPHIFWHFSSEWARHFGEISGRVVAIQTGQLFYFHIANCGRVRWKGWCSWTETHTNSRANYFLQIIGMCSKYNLSFNFWGPETQRTELFFENSSCKGLVLAWRRCQYLIC